MTSKPVMAGEELFTHYGYKQEYSIPFDVPWYWDLKRQIEKKERLDDKRAKAVNKK